MKRILIGNLREILDLDNIVSGLESQISAVSTSLTNFVNNTFTPFKTTTETDIDNLEIQVNTVNTTLSGNISSLDTRLSGEISDLEDSLTESITQVNENLSENIQGVSESLEQHLNGLKFSVTGEGKIHVELEETENSEE